MSGRAALVPLARRHRRGGNMASSVDRIVDEGKAKSALGGDRFVSAQTRDLRRPGGYRN
jgi:hypothetical protein